MFNEGEIVVCIDISDLIGTEFELVLDLYGKYIVDGVGYIVKDGIGTNVLYLKNISILVSSNRFISLSEFRKKKINNIISCLKKEI